MTTEVCFNVGGKRYEVSRALLEMHPNTKLAQSASEHWETNLKAEIFMERDGDRFTYVLDYLRDGRACLPLVIPKDALVADLEYFGVEHVDETKIGSASVARTRMNAQDEIEAWELEIETLEVAKTLAAKYMASGSLDVCVDKEDDPVVYQIFYKLRSAPHGIRALRCKTGILMTMMTSSNKKTLK